MLWFVTYISGCKPERPPTQCLRDRPACRHQWPLFVFSFFEVLQSAQTRCPARITSLSYVLVVAHFRLFLLVINDNPKDNVVGFREDNDKESFPETGSLMLRGSNSNSGSKAKAKARLSIQDGDESPFAIASWLIELRSNVVSIQRS